ncbi:MAG: peptidase M12 [Saprospiraceae bacterium]
MKKESVKICTILKKKPHQIIANLEKTQIKSLGSIARANLRSPLLAEEKFVHPEIILRSDVPVMHTRILLPKSSMWETGTEIRIAFMSGNKKIKDHVKELAAEWLTYANLHFVYVKKTEHSDVRITFNSRQGSSSAVGIECRDYTQKESTINFGWLNVETKEADFRSVVLHEFGHMIGCGHEHESPKNGGIPWDKEKAYRYYERTQKWTAEDVDEQVFDRYKNDKIRGTALDKKSIMMYAIPESITKGDFRVGWNTRLSESDKEFIGKTYPFS